MISIIEILIGGGIFLVLLALILLIINNTKKTVKTFKINNPEELKKFMEEHKFPHEMIQNMMNENSQVEVKTTTRKIKYVNGKIVSDETTTSNQNISPLTNCPNCGSIIEPENDGTCKYCNTSFNTYQINNK